MKSSQAWVTVLLAVSGLQALAIAGLIAAAPKSTQTAAARPRPTRASPSRSSSTRDRAKARDPHGQGGRAARHRHRRRPRRGGRAKTVALGTVQSVAEAPIIVTASVPGIVAMPTDASALRPGDRLSAKQPVLRLATLVDMAGKNPITTTAGIALQTRRSKPRCGRARSRRRPRSSASRRRATAPAACSLAAWPSGASRSSAV